jgi:putative transposase
MMKPCHPALSLRKQSKLIGLPLSSYYYQPVPETPLNLLLMKLIDKEYLKHPFYGVRRMTKHFLDHHPELGPVNRKRIARLMRIMGIQGIHPKKKLSIPSKDHQVYPYLLKGVTIDHPDQVWSVDITYIPMKKGFCYLVAIVDWYSRSIISWKLSVTLEVDFCIEALQQALQISQPTIFNSDQGSQFTSKAFVQLLLDRNIQVSMDGKGRVFDNIFIERFWRTIKYEEVYLHSYENVWEAERQIGAYIHFYNLERYHSSLGYRTPNTLYQDKKVVLSYQKEGETISL